MMRTPWEDYGLKKTTANDQKKTHNEVTKLREFNIQKIQRQQEK